MFKKILKMIGIGKKEDTTANKCHYEIGMDVSADRKQDNTCISMESVLEEWLETPKGEGSVKQAVENSIGRIEENESLKSVTEQISNAWSKTNAATEEYENSPEQKRSKIQKEFAKQHELLKWLWKEEEKLQRKMKHAKKRQRKKYQKQIDELKGGV